VFKDANIPKSQYELLLGLELVLALGGGAYLMLQKKSNINGCRASRGNVEHQRNNRSLNLRTHQALNAIMVHAAEVVC
jgi:hypothetical protein